MMDWLLVTALALSPALPLWRVSTRAFARVRDIALLGALAAATVWLARDEPIFSPLAAWFLIVWPRPHLLPPRHEPRSSPELATSLLAWIAVAAGWFTARALEPRLVDWLPWAWVAYAAAQGPIVQAQRWRLLRAATPAEAGGTFGQRTLCAAFLALAAPFAPWWAWPALAWGLLLTCSWGAWLAVAAGLAVVHPRLIPWMALCGAGLAVAGRSWGHPYNPLRVALIALPRGDSLDSLRHRWDLWRIMARSWRQAWPWGTGPDSMSRWARRWQVIYRTPLPLGEAHSEPLHLAWEYGVAGALTVLLIIWRVGSGLRWGDPWSASAVVAGVLCLGTFPLRVAPLGLVILVVWGRVAP